MHARVGADTELAMVIVDFPRLAWVDEPLSSFRSYLFPCLHGCINCQNSIWIFADLTSDFAKKSELVRFCMLFGPILDNSYLDRKFEITSSVAINPTLPKLIGQFLASS